MKMLITAKPGGVAEVHLTETDEDMMKVLFKGSPPPGMRLSDIQNIAGSKIIDVQEFTDHRPIKT
jgi:hypothetical protein